MQWHKSPVIALALAAGFALGACSSFDIPSKKIDYKSTTKLPQLDIPPDLVRPGGDDRFVVPDGPPKSTATFSDYSKDRAGKPAIASVGGSAVLPASTTYALIVRVLSVGWWFRVRRTSCGLW